MQTLNSVEETRKAVTDFYNEKIDSVASLKGRWSCEKEYEDFNEYKKVITEMLAKYGLKPNKITKNFVIEGENEFYEWQFKITTRHASWRGRVK